MLTLSKKLRLYKPVLLGIALRTTLIRVNDEELNNFIHIVPDRDDRKCQTLLNYDRLHEVIEEAIEEYQLPRPGLFQHDYIDRHALTYYMNEGVRH